MIKINLARLKAASFANTGAGENTQTRASSSLAGGTMVSGLTKITKMNFNNIRDLPLRKMLILPVVILASTFVDEYLDSLVQAEDAKIQTVQADLVKIRADIAKISGFEAIRDQLEKDEFILKTKVQALKTLRDGREDAPRALVALSSGIPQEMWLESITFSPLVAEVKGFTTDMNFVSDFMRSLGDYAYYGALELDETSQKKDDKPILFNYFSIKGARKISLGSTPQNQHPGVKR